MSEVVNQNEWRVVGMSRSGNHAIINWLLAQTAGRTCFLNCTEPKNNPFCRPRPLENGLPYAVNYAEFDLERERGGRWSRKDYLLYSHEDVFLGLLNNQEAELRHDEWVGPTARRRDILVLRDPFNLFASRLKSDIGEIPPHTAVRIWKQHAKQFIGVQRYLPRRPVLISYNEWVQSQSYRRELAGRLELPFCDTEIHRVAGTAGGSSFDSLTYRRRASKMRVFDRWRQFAEDVQYLRLFDEEMIRLAESAFGPLTAAERIAAFLNNGQYGPAVLPTRYIA